MTASPKAAPPCRAGSERLCIARAIAVDPEVSCGRAGRRRPDRDGEDRGADHELRGNCYRDRHAKCAGARVSQRTAFSTSDVVEYGRRRHLHHPKQERTKDYITAATVSEPRKDKTMA